MIKLVKTISSLVILVCFFLPLSQCSLQTQSGLGSESNQEAQASNEIQYRNIVISESIFGEAAELSIESFVLPMLFSLPLIFSLMPSFSKKKKVLKLLIQSLFSVWFVYWSYVLVFSIGNPLRGGWILSCASIVFFILCLIEWVPTKHHKLKNERP